ncbi:MAG: amino acid permease [Rhodobacteraceae bacterium]|nr:amino acid permease [Paracoccaceae bacterium]
MADDDAKLGVFSTFSVGIGGMVGGGIFAVTGLTIETTRAAAPLAFVVAGIVALLTSYSYLRLTLAFPGEGGTVDFLNRAFGGGILTGAANILLLLSYVVLLSVYAYAFGSYGANLLPPAQQELWVHVLTSGIVVALLGLNILAPRLVIESENLLNAIKLLILGGLVVAGFLLPMDWSQLDPVGAVSPVGLVAGAMLIFLNYEGFELIANASPDVADPRRALPVAYLGGVVVVILLYALIVAVVLGHLSLAQVRAASDTALSAAGQAILGRAGYLAIVVAALLATGSAINATLFSTGRLAYVVAKTGELPASLEGTIRGTHGEGAIICAVLAIVIANVVPLDAIATMGSAGFLLLFFLVNLANVRLARQTGSRAWLSALAALATLGALVVLCVSVEENPASRNHLWIFAGLIGVSLVIEIVYRGLTGRRITLHRRRRRT